MKKSCPKGQPFFCDHTGRVCFFALVRKTQKFSQLLQSCQVVRAVPTQYYEGAVALGGTHERAIFTVVLPAAKSGVVAAIVLGIGRAIGETMAVIMVAGNQPRMPRGIFQGVRTLTANIVIEMGYASGLHREALIATGVVLFVFILLLNFCVALLNRGKNHE